MSTAQVSYRFSYENLIYYFKLIHLCNRFSAYETQKIFFRFPTSIMSVSFNATGTQLAIAASYMNELKERPSPEPESTVVVRKITDVEARPK